jgi:hypothetical protein
MLALPRGARSTATVLPKLLRHSLVTVSESLDRCGGPNLRSRLPLVFVNVHAVQSAVILKRFTGSDRSLPLGPNGCLGSLWHPYRATWHT